MPYMQTRSMPFGPVTWYRILRQHNHFAILPALRYALWLAYGNEMMPPGELRAWIDRQISAHPWAIGITLVIWADLLLIFAWILATR